MLGMEYTPAQRTAQAIVTMYFLFPLRLCFLVKVNRRGFSEKILPSALIIQNCSLTPRMISFLEIISAFRDFFTTPFEQYYFYKYLLCASINSFLATMNVAISTAGISR